jgi:hypothetical protein
LDEQDRDFSKQEIGDRERDSAVGDRFGYTTTNDTATAKRGPGSRSLISRDFRAWPAVSCFALLGILDRFNRLDILSDILRRQFVLPTVCKHKVLVFGDLRPPDPRSSAFLYSTALVPWLSFVFGIMFTRGLSSGLYAFHGGDCEDCVSTSFYPLLP